MTKVIACANQKGGVGKTTTAVNLAAALQHAGKPTLLIDMDPQGNATMGSGIEKHYLRATIGDVMLGEATVEVALQETDAMGYALLPANRSLTRAEIELLDADGRETVLKALLTPLKTRYEYILIDCPPSLNMLTINSLVAADEVLLPVQCEYYSLEGLVDLRATIDHVVEKANPALRIGGILRTMYDARNRLTKEVSEQLKKHFGNDVLRTVIPRNVRLAEAPSYGMSILLYDKKSQGAAAYQALAGELMRRHQERADAHANQTASTA